MNKLVSVGWLLFWCWPKGLYLHTKLILLACMSVAMTKN